MSNSPASQQRLLLTLITLGGFVVGLSFSLVGVIAPQIAVTFEADSVLTSWLANAFLLASLFSQLPAGRLADIVGRRRVYLGGLMLYLCGGVLCSVATDIYSLLGFRVLQGIGSSCVFATGMAALYDVFPREKRGMAGGTLIAGIYLGLTFGPLVGGFVSEYFGWRMVFLVPVPLGLLVFALMTSTLTGTPAQRPDAKFDYLGALLCVVWASAFVFGMTRLPSYLAAVMIFIGVSAFIIFVRLQLRSPQPLLRVRIFAENRMFASSLVVAFLMYTCTAASMFVLSFYLQLVLEFTPKYAGVVLVVPAIFMAIFARPAGRLSDRIEPRFLCSSGMLVSALGFSCLVLTDAQSSIYQVVLGTSLMGLGFVFFSSPNNNAILGGVPAHDLSAAAACANMARDFGNVIGLAVVAISFSLFLHGATLQDASTDDLQQAIHFCLYYCIAASILASGLSLMRGDLRSKAEAVES